MSHVINNYTRANHHCDYLGKKNKDCQPECPPAVAAALTPITPRQHSAEEEHGDPANMHQHWIVALKRSSALRRRPRSDDFKVDRPAAPGGGFYAQFQAGLFRKGSDPGCARIKSAWRRPPRLGQRQMRSVNPRHFKESRPVVLVRLWRTARSFIAWRRLGAKADQPS